VSAVACFHFILLRAQAKVLFILK